MKKQFTTENLLQKMENIVKRTLKSYKSDFYNYDVSMINTIDGKKEKQRLVWIVRELGTFLIYMDGTEEEKKASNDFLQAIRATWNNRKEYQIIFNGSAWSINKLKTEA